ncbi:MAG: alpha-E domain-containing protein [Methylocella sp.]
MLSRTADNLYWLARYVERADFLARIVEATQRLAALPTNYSGTGTEWESALESSGAAAGFHETRGAAEEASVVEYLTFAADNPSSIRNCIELARANARAVRTALTVEMWDAINSAWIELKRFEADNRSRGYDRRELSKFLEFVKKTSLDYDGCSHRTMLRNDAFWFSRLGLYIERADNTARILDVKYHVLLPENEAVGGSLDYFQWTAILRAVSALTAYHWVYRENVKPWLIADLLILKLEMPSSLIACYDNIVRFLDAIGRAYGRTGPAQRQAHNVMHRLEEATTNEIFKMGLHEFITAFVRDNDRLGQTITEQYLVYDSASAPMAAPKSLIGSA